MTPLDGSLHLELGQLLTPPAFILPAYRTNLPMMPGSRRTGLLGLDVARQIDRAVAELESCERLILDLRGHVGGGLGVLRLMRHLTPEKLPIGYTVTRKRAEQGYEKERLPKLDRLPTHLPN